MKNIASSSAIALLLCACSGGETTPTPNQPTSNSQQARPAINTAIYQPQETPIPRSMPGDKGRYYLLEMSKNGNIVSATHSRIGVDSVIYTKTETNCTTMKMREIGYSETSAAAIATNPTDWFDLVPGSSKSDLAAFVCKR